MVKLLYLKCIFALSVVLGILSVAGLVTLIVLWQTKLSPFQDYALVVDAGSSQSKIFVYTWPADKSDGLGLTSRVTQVKYCSPNGAITSVTNPTQDNIEEYFTSAITNCTDAIPYTRKSRALIFLGGTAGLRLAEMKDSNYTNTLLNATRTYFSSLGLLFKAPEYQVRIISGTEEGLSGWISTNILMRELFENNQPLQTYGVTDMGGASVQLSFISPNALQDRFNLSLFNTEYNVYSHSYLCYGNDQFRYVYIGQSVNKANGSEVIYDPCFQNGYTQNFTYNDVFSSPCVQNRSAPSPAINTSSIFKFIGTGDFAACTTAVQERLNSSVCTSTSCSFDNVYQPKPIASSLRFIAISGWYSIFNDLAPNVTILPNKDTNYDLNTTSLSQIKAAIKAICSQSWSDVPNPNRFRPLLCFNSLYHWTLFEHGFGMTDENLKNIQIVKKIDSNDIGWSLGYMINQTNYLEPEFRPERLLTKSEFAGLVFLCTFCIIASIIAGVIAMYYIQRYRVFDKTG